jgi:hypothetical protein
MDGHGAPPFDLWEVDIRRAQPFQKNRRYLKERAPRRWACSTPTTSPTARRPRPAACAARRCTSTWRRHKGAVFGELAGWERANWYARDRGRSANTAIPGSARTGSTTSATSIMAVRTGVGLFDMTSFGKIRVEGPMPKPSSTRLRGNDVDVPAGRIVYTQMLNDRGGIEADLTVTRLSETAFLVSSPPPPRSSATLPGCAAISATICRDHRRDRPARRCSPSWVRGRAT